MPADMPYPGESDEQFLARMMAQMQGGPGTPMPAPDPRLLAMQQMTGQAPGTVPVEEMMTNDPSFGGDASMADAYGGPDPYTAGLPGATGPRTPMQNRNRRIALYPESTTDDDFEQAEMLGDYEDETDEEAQEPRYRRIDDPENRATPPVRFRGSDEVGELVGPDGDGVPSTEDELDMVQRQITKTGSDLGPSEYGMTGDLENDIAALKSLSEDDYDAMGAVDDFISRHGEAALPPEFRHWLDEAED